MLVLVFAWILPSSLNTMTEFTTEKKEECGGDHEAVKTSFDNGVIELESMPQFSAEAEKKLVRKIDFRYACFESAPWE